MAFRCHQDNGSHCHDSTQALALLDVIPRSKGLRGRLRCRPDSLHELPASRAEIGQCQDIVFAETLLEHSIHRSSARRDDWDPLSRDTQQVGW